MFRSYASSFSGFGSITVIGKDTLVANDVSPSVILEGLSAKNNRWTPG